jgi:hypothetical protein
MKLIVISSPITVPNEHEIINSFFEEGLELFQLYKPSFSKEETERFVQQIPHKHQNRIALHTDFPKFHALEPLGHFLADPLNKRTCFFLSPVFDSISKAGYKSNFDLQEIKVFLEKQYPPLEGEDRGKAIALGGIDENKIETCCKLGFAGVAVLGALWKDSSPTEKFKQLKAICQKKDLAY